MSLCLFVCQDAFPLFDREVTGHKVTRTDLTPLRHLLAAYLLTAVAPGMEPAAAGGIGGRGEISPQQGALPLFP